MLILPPYSRREDEQMQSSLKFSGLDAFEKASKSSLINLFDYADYIFRIEGICYIGGFTGEQVIELLELAFHIFPVLININGAPSTVC